METVSYTHLDVYKRQHNKVYWSLEDYIGVGCASSSYINGIRKVNESSISKYIKKIKQNENVVVEEHINSIEDEIEEFIFMGLRMLKGIDLSLIHILINKK